MTTLLVLREPGGRRSLQLPCWIVGQREEAPIGEVDRLIIVPGLDAGARLRLENRADGFYAELEGAADGLRNGVALRVAEACRLQLGDVLSFGDAQIRIDDLSTPTIEILHLEGNETLDPPLATTRAATRPLADEWVDAADSAQSSRQTRQLQPEARQRSRALYVGGLAAAVMLLGLLTLFASLERIDLKVYPQQARVSIEGVGWRAGDSLLALPGARQITASLEGYESVRREVSIRRGETLALEFTLAPLPGVLEIDTAGVKAIAYVDGARAGEVPGELSVPQGERTITLRAERYLDEIVRLEVQGRGIRQPLTVTLRPSWGALQISADRAATLVVDDPRSEWTLPAKVDLPAGLRRLTVSSPDAKSWQSTVLIEAGRTTIVGPLQLGAPDGRLRVITRPAGAAIMTGGVFAGRTPATIDLAPGVEHEISLSLDGYRTVDRRVRVEPGRLADLGVSLQMVAVSLQVSGQPEAAEIWLDNTRLGTAPLTVELPARRYTLEVRKAGLGSQRIEVDLTSAVPRQIEYRLVPEGRPANWTAPPVEWRGQSGMIMRLVTGGSFLMGSDRREQGRRANEFQRRVTLVRPFYMAVREVTNAEFRQFKKDHSSGFLGKRTLDLDSAAVSGVSWQDAVQYCNWLSARDGLPPAYEQQQGRWVLRQPVTTGYRLPTEAEWEFVARQVDAAGRGRRYEWGDSLPPPRNFANLAGVEVGEELPKTLPDWQDDHVTVAPSGRYAANALGVFDMSGNVSEWMHDFYAPAAADSASSDPLGPSSGARHVVKGASWRTSVYTDLRIAWREGAEGAAQDRGFRVARYAE